MQRTVPVPRAHLSYGMGILAGLIGGIVMAMVTMVITQMLGMGMFAMPNMIAGLILGQSAMAGGLMVFLVGMMIHMMLSAMFGLIYAIVANRISHEFIWTGLIWGLILWPVNFYVIGSVWPPAHMMAQNEPTWLAIVSHGIFGLVTGLLGKAWARTI